MDLINIQCKLVQDGQKKLILCIFPYNRNQLAQFKKEFPSARWSRTKKAWILKDWPHHRKKLGIDLAEAGLQYLNQMYAVNQRELCKFRDMLQQKMYAVNTVNTYLGEFAQLLILIKAKPVYTLSTEQLNSYLLYCIKILKMSEYQVHSRINAIKAYFNLVLGSPQTLQELIRPKSRQSLPKVLSKAEVKLLFESCSNLKHLLILKMAYGMGLRVSEIVNIKPNHIDIDRMQMLVSGAKGKKDRYVNFPKTLVSLLHDYCMMYQPTVYLFQGQFQSQYSTRSAQAVFKNAMKTAGIHKSIGIHGLRHSYATHLLESGTDMVFIQKLLGHKQVKTTEIYAKVSTRLIARVPSPLDDLE